MRLIAAMLAMTLETPAVAQRFDLATARPFDGRAGTEPGQPGLFSVAVPEGNYRVSVTLGSPVRASVTTVKAESRRLMLDAVAVPKGRSVTRSFVVNVRNAQLTAPPENAPGGVAVRLKPREIGSFTWDDKLTIEVLGDTAAVSSVLVEPVDVPTLFLLGDSTVTDQRSEPAASWGQMLPAFMASDIAVANHAESGETLKSFVTELRLDKLLAQVKPGDWAMIQFGHNDQKVQWPQTYAEAETTYRSYLRTYIAELRRRGAHAILVTSPERRNWTGSHIRRTLADYAAAAKTVAAEEHVPLIDLSSASVAIYEALGPERAPLAFNDGGKDATHHNNYGAWVLARAVAEGVRAEVPALATHLAPGLAPFDATRPPDPARFRIDPSAAFSSQRPAGS